MHNNTRVLVVDDSAIVRNILSRGLSMNEGIEVVGAASDPYKARDMIVKLRPDVLTLDVEMPRMDGLQFLKKLMPQYPMPVVMVSSLTESGSSITLDALSAGAVDFVCKPSSNLKTGLMGMMKELSEKVVTASHVDVSNYKNHVNSKMTNKLAVQNGHYLDSTLITIGASTGGTEALRRIITTLPANYPGIVVVQHMPEKFTKMFADRLNEQSKLYVKEAVSGEEVEKGKVLIAPGGLQTQILKTGSMYKVVCRAGQKVCGHRPSVDVLFRSAARFAGKNAIGIMLTGMGSDGADAMIKMREAGARTFAQDEKTSVVFGMPKEAYERGGAEELVALELIPNKIKALLEERKEWK
jgi:two-component system, chemotaxis family, protein-glutamate methylesterase/glutaminase